MSCPTCADQSPGIHVARIRGGITSTLLILLSLVCGNSVSAQSSGSDWKIYGVIQQDERPVHVFYNAAGVTPNTDGNVELWTKGISARDIDSSVKSMASDSIAKDRLAKKLASGYVPPLATAKGLTGTQANTLVIEEEIADFYPLNAIQSVHWELDCQKKRARVLEASIYTNGGMRSSKQTSLWLHPTPDNFFGAVMLLPLFCAQP
jgi:hypothetical protein